MNTKLKVRNKVTENVKYMIKIGKQYEDKRHEKDFPTKGDMGDKLEKLQTLSTKRKGSK